MRTAKVAIKQLKGMDKTMLPDRGSKRSFCDFKFLDFAKFSTTIYLEIPYLASYITQQYIHNFAFIDRYNQVQQHQPLE